MISTSNQPNSSLVKQVKLGAIDSKKKDLKALETTLKKRINELKELCLQEGDITGQLPIDYPLQPREPIPQIRRRRQTDDNLNNTYCVQPIDTTISQQQYKHHRQYNQPIISNNINGGNSKQFHSRPTSTISTNSSPSICSSNARSTQNRYGTQMNSPAYTSSLHQPSFDNGLLYRSHQNDHQNHTPNLYDVPLLTNHFKQRANKLNDSFENDTIGFMRANSTSSFSSSSCSRTSSTLSNSTLPKSPYMNLHPQSYSDSLSGDDNILPSSRNTLSLNELKSSASQRQKLNNSKGISETHQNELMKMRDIKLNFESKDCEELLRTLEQPRDFNIDGIGKFQPYYEETKPFQMSDFYKYSTKHRQKINDALKADSEKTNETREGSLIETTHNYNNRNSSCCNQEDQIQASLKLIEKSGQKLIEATAKAIAGNPGLAEKINNILPMCL